MKHPQLKFDRFKKIEIRMFHVTKKEIKTNT